MNEALLIQIMKDINNENIRFGSCEVKFTFHDGKIVFYEITVCKRRNVSISRNLKKENNYGNER
ncbi:hypothetical protein MSI_22350 [Treponema sp. JC4]|uniref:hypothetical protein n=1 Tax=Treponema sp. JC4 TaxID=1124982 RepID=UPI00025B0347|nr:hypothetical protein [Treponema sp. JC4]EID84294.1 hypothetical protein MSI_22350 [Treponema sp. JC4]